MSESPAETLVTPPPMKKMKQGRLPFKVLSPRVVQQAESQVLPIQQTSLKKRKLSDTAPGPLKASKTPRSDENQLKAKKVSCQQTGKKVDDVDNEVSSSSEADIAQNKLQKSVDNVKERKTGIMDMYVQMTQKLEVSTTNNTVDSTGIIETYSEEETTPCEETKETTHCEETEAGIMNCNKTDRVLDVRLVTEKTCNINCDSTETGNNNAETTEAGIDSNNSTPEAGIDSNNSTSEAGIDSNNSTSEAGIDSNNSTSEAGIDSKNSTSEAGIDSNNCTSVVGIDSNNSTSEAGIDSNNSTSEISCTETGSNNCNTTLTGSNIPETIGDKSSVQDGDDFNDSLESDMSANSQEEDQSDSSQLKSPQYEMSTKAKTSPNSTNLVKTPLSSKKLAEREEKRKQREAEKEERRLKKIKELEDKKKQKQEEKEKKEEMRKQKEQEKKEKLEVKEKERLEKLRQKEEERKKKEEEKQKKEEERLKKVEEKKKELEEKQRQKEEKEKEKLQEENKGKKVSEKQKSLFTSFFTKKERDALKPEDGSSIFMQFPLKADMRLAPVIRVDIQNKRNDLEHLDEVMPTQNCQELYVQQLKAKKLSPGKGWRTWPREDADVVIMEEEKPGCKYMRAKYIFFHENHRPPYYGTWTKQSQRITARKPFVKDQDLFDYEVDSDDEWEEEEPGESLSDSGGEEDEGEKAAAAEEDDEDDGFFVPHGYLSEGEGCEDDEDDVTPERLKARQLARAKAFEADMKKKTELLKPIAIGCCWWQPEISIDPAFNMLQKFQVVGFGSLPIDLTVERSGEEKQKKKKINKEDRKKPQLQAVPDEAMCDLVKLVHGNSCGIAKLIKEFREYWRLKDMGVDIETYKLNKDTSVSQESEDLTEADTSQNETKEETKYNISKRQLDKTIKELAVYEKRSCFKRACWYVNNNILEKYNLTDLVIPTSWMWVTREPVKRTSETPVEGRSPTPTQNLTNKEGNIRKFAKPGIAPKFPVISPKPIKPNTVIASKPIKSLVTTTSVTDKGSPAFKPITSFVTKVADGGSPASKPIKSFGCPTVDSYSGDVTESMEVSTNDTDCAITCVQLKPDKSQPTVLSMFTAGKHVGKNNVKPQVVKSAMSDRSVVSKKLTVPSDRSPIVSKQTAIQPESSPNVGKKTAVSSQKINNIIAVLTKKQDDQIKASSKDQEAVDNKIPPILGSAECPMEID